MCLLKLSTCLRAGMAAMCVVTFAHALDPSRTSALYIREQWTIANEFPGDTVHAISQTPDGYLWIGTDTGLIRFDGFNFRVVPLPPLSPSSNSPVLGLTTDADGNLLVQLQGAAVLRQRNGKFETVETSGIPGASQVTAMWRNTTGQVLIWDLSDGALGLRTDKIQQLSPSTVLGSVPVISM